MIQRLIQKLNQSGNSYSLLANGLFAAFGLGTFLVLTRKLNQEIFGLWVLFITISSLLDMLRLGLTGTATIRILSSSHHSKKTEIIGTSYRLSITATMVMSAILLSLFAIINHWLTGNPYRYILLFYPLLAVVNLPIHQSLVIAQGFINFKKVFVIRTITGVSSFVSMLICVVWVDNNIITLLITYIIAHAFTSIIIILLRWDGIGSLSKFNNNIKKQIMHFGKYATASYIGSNLLRSSDTIILSMAAFMGAEAIAIYAIPMKFVEAVEIPLRSFSATAFPRLSSLWSKNKKQFYQTLKKYTVYTTLLLIPVVTVVATFPEFFLLILGGKNFIEHLHTQKSIAFVLCIYILVLPLDRYSGIALFALNLPRENFIKISVMLISNVIFNLVAIYYFKSLTAMALATLIFTILGIFIGWHKTFKCIPGEHVSLKHALQKTIHKALAFK